MKRRNPAHLREESGVSKNAENISNNRTRKEKSNNTSFSKDKRTIKVLPKRHQSKNTDGNKKENTSSVLSQKTSFDDSDELSAYELLRQRNIEERQNLFQELNLNQVSLCFVRGIPTLCRLF